MGHLFDEGVLVARKTKTTWHQIKSETFVLYLAARDPRTPWYAKLPVAGIVAYAFSPIDLIPDFVPVIGYLDDLIMLPLGITLAIKMVPSSVLAECRTWAQDSIQNERPVNRAASAVIVVIWLLMAMLCAVWVYEAFGGKSCPPQQALCIPQAQCWQYN